MMSRLTIDKLGGRGEGVAQGPDALIFVPYALAGETIVAEVDGSRGALVEVLTPSPHRIAPFCRYFAHCGGCAVQTLAADSYARWKRDLVTSALRRAGLTNEVSDLADAHGAGRRRAIFHARLAQGRPATGFMQARAHEVVEIDSCPVLAPSMDEALPAARAIAQALAASGKPLDILVTATASGLDVDLKGHGPLGEAETQTLVRIALAHDLARFSNHGTIVVSRRMPLLAMGKAMVAPPPGAFLQATEAGEEALAARVCAHVAAPDTSPIFFPASGPLPFGWRRSQQSMRSILRKPRFRHWQEPRAPKVCGRSRSRGATFSGVRSARRSSNDMTRSYSIRPARAPKAKPWRSAHPRCLLSSPYPAMPGPLPAMPRSYAPAAMK
jgi:23S rRNA (uracil1939-C5)-methyltransferase